jgi:hypothetical protein
MQAAYVAAVILLCLTPHKGRNRRKCGVVQVCSPQAVHTTHPAHTRRQVHLQQTCTHLQTYCASAPASARALLHLRPRAPHL